MNTIHLAEPGQQPVAYPEDQAHALWAQGRVSAQALYWREGMPEWRLVAVKLVTTIYEMQKSHAEPA